MNHKSLKLLPVVTLVILFSIACNFLLGTSQPQASQMGTIKVVNYHVRASDWYPGGKNLPDTREYGICFIAYPAIPGIIRPDFDTILAKDGLQEVEKQQTTWALPAGTYTVQEWQFDSEINQDPFYSPAFRTLVRPPEDVLINVDETIAFGSMRTHEAPGDFVEGTLLNPHCAASSQQAGGLPPLPPQGTGTETTPLNSNDGGMSQTATGIWVLKQVQPDVGKTEVQFEFSGLSCNGGATATSTETDGTITTAGTCQIKGAQIANEVTKHTWTRPPDQLMPGQEISITITAASSGLCNWTDLTTEEGCRNNVSTRHSVWQGEGGPWSQTEFPFTNLIYDSGNAGQTANAKNLPTSIVTWSVPDGSGGSRTLVVQFNSHASEGSVWTNFWYEWQGG